MVLQRMTTTAEISGHDEAGSSGTTIEIKIKTMDSQTYALRVDKQVPVPTLKEQIASVTGVVREQQRLICRGRVLKDDQLLSAYHVEDGHTLHLVARQPPLSSMENLPSDTAFGLSSGSRSEYYQIAPGVVVEAFNMHGQGDRNLSDIGRIVSAVLGSIGIAGPGNVGEGTGLREHGLESLGRRPVRGEATETNQPHSEQPGTRHQNDRLRPHNAFGVGTTFSLGAGQAPVIPDALSTLSQYLTNMRREFSGNGETDAGPASSVGTEQTEAGSVHSRNSQGLPTPASLAELLFSTREMLDQHTGECLVHLARQLESQASVTDPDARLSTQSSAVRTGVLLHNLGVYLLELGRSIMTLRLGRASSEAVVNAGPAVYISSSGPRPIMVQPLPFQPGASFSAPPTGTLQNGPILSHGFGSALLPRRIDIQIRRGSLARQQETDGSQQPSALHDSSAGVNGETVTNQPTSATSSNPSFPSGTSVRVLPLRTMVAAIPAIPDLNRVPSESSGNSSGLYYPLFGRFQSMTSRNISSRTGSQPSAEHQPSGLRSEQHVTPEATAQQQNIENPPGHSDRPLSRTIDISIYSSGGVQSDHNPEVQPPDSVLQFLRGLFPGGELHVENLSSHGTTTLSFPEQENVTGMAAAVPEAESRPTEDAIFFSRMLQQIMPFISQLPQTEQNDNGHSGEAGPSTPVENSDAGSSRRPTDFKEVQPNPKRQKME